MKKRRLLFALIGMLGFSILSGVGYDRQVQAAHCVPCCTVNISQNECCKTEGQNCTIFPCVIIIEVEKPPRDAEPVAN